MVERHCDSRQLYLQAFEMLLISRWFLLWLFLRLRCCLIFEIVLKKLGSLNAMRPASRHFGNTQVITEVVRQVRYNE